MFIRFNKKHCFYLHYIRFIRATLVKIEIFVIHQTHLHAQTHTYELNCMIHDKLNENTKILVLKRNIFIFFSNKIYLKLK